MFGMMFGDMGHGSILAFFGIFLTVFNDKLKQSAFKDFLQVRYFLLLLGLSSFYCGFMYNEFFAMPAQIFSSCYKIMDKQKWCNASEANLAKCEGGYFFERENFECNYPMGVDPVWGLST